MGPRVTPSRCDGVTRAAQTGHFALEDKAAEIALMRDFPEAFLDETLTIDTRRRVYCRNPRAPPTVA
jgi:hypothetical protein